MDNKKKSDLKKSCTYQEEYATGVLVQRKYNPMEQEKEGHSRYKVLLQRRYCVKRIRVCSGAYQTE